MDEENTLISQQNTLYPIFLKIEQLNTLVVGGGEVALEKLNFLLKSSPNATITVVSPHFDPEVRKLSAGYPRVRLIERTFITDDLIGKNLTLICTNNEQLNFLIKAEANSRNVLANVADTPALCDFYLGSIVTKGNLKIAISTNGKSPSFAKRFREFLEEALPNEIPELLENLRSFRNSLTGDFRQKVKKLNDLTAVLTNSDSKGRKVQTDLVE